MTNFPSKDGYDHARAALADRRQRAREAAHDLADGETSPAEIIEAAIETATRVRVDDEIMHAYRMAVLRGANAGVIAAFRAAGFEAEQ